MAGLAPTAPWSPMFFLAAGLAAAPDLLPPVPNLSVPPLEAALRIFLAMMLGGVLGWERQRKSKPAGLKTHMLVSLGAASFSLMTFELYASLISARVYAGDPMRTVTAIVGGLGFLGAGAIIRSGDSVYGVTTAATVWVAGALGVACGTGQYVIAATVISLSIIVLTLVHAVEKKLADGPYAPFKGVRHGPSGRPPHEKETGERPGGS